MLNADTGTPGIDIFSLGRQRLDWLQQRQSVLASNIANANTPDYTPEDISPFHATLSGLESAMSRVSLDGAHENDIETGSRKPNEQAINGNGVSLDYEMEQVALNNDQQHLASNLYARYMNMFQTALGK